MNEYYYINFLNECIIRPVYLKHDMFNKYKSNQDLINKAVVSINYNNQTIKLNDNKQFKLKEFINKSKNLNNKPLKNLDLNNHSYVNKLYLNDQINYINNNYNISKKELIKTCNTIYNSLGGAAAYK